MGVMKAESIETPDLMRTVAAASRARFGFEWEKVL
jgi:hypothetical protein